MLRRNDNLSTTCSTFLVPRAAIAHGIVLSSLAFYIEQSEAVHAKQSDSHAGVQPESLHMRLVSRNISYIMISCTAFQTNLMLSVFVAQVTCW